MSTKIASRPFIIAAGTALVLSGIGGYAWHEIHRPRILEAYVFDLPGNPGLFIRTPGDRRILVNGGSNAEVVRHLTDILPFYSRRIDTVIVTSPEGKNVAGLIDVLNRYKVDEVVVPGITLESLGLASSTDPIYQIFLETVSSRNVPIKEVVAGNRLVLDAEDSNNVVADILFPVGADEFKYSKASGPEMLFKVNYGLTSLSFMGNASVKAQKFIAANDTVPTNVLIYSHNAEASNVSRELVSSLDPEYLVYSQAVAKVSNKTKKKVEADPLAGILNDHRFNIKGKGMLKIISDGNEVSIKQSF